MKNETKTILLRLLEAFSLSGPFCFGVLLINPYIAPHEIALNKLIADHMFLSWGILTAPFMLFAYGFLSMD